MKNAFVLASLENVVSYLGFDAFWLHLFNLYNKSSHVMLRPGFSVQWKNQVKNYVATPYIAEESKVKFIN